MTDIREIVRLMSVINDNLDDLSKVTPASKELSKILANTPYPAQIARQSVNLSMQEAIDMIEESKARVRASGKLESITLPNDANKQAKNTVDEIRKFEKILLETNKVITQKGLVANFPHVYAERLDSFMDSFQRGVQNLEGADRLQLTAGSADRVQKTITDAYSRSKDLIDQIYSGGYLNNSQLTQDQANQAQALFAALQREEELITKTTDDINKASRISDRTYDYARKRKEDLSRNIDTTFGGLTDVMRAMHSKNFFRAAAGATDLIAHGIKGIANRASKPKTEGQGAWMKELSKLTKAFSGLNMIIMVLEGIKLLVTSLMGFSDHSAAFNKELTQVHGLTSQGINLEADVNTDYVVKSFQHYQNLFIEFGMDTKTFLDPKQLMEMTGSLEKFGIKLQEFSGTQAEFNTTMLSILQRSSQAAMSQSEMASVYGEFQQSFGYDMDTTSGFLDMFIDGAKEAGIPARAMIEGIRNTNGDLSLAGENMMLALALQKQGVKGGLTNLEGGLQGVAAYKTALDNLDPRQIAVLRDKLGGNALADEAANKLKRTQSRMTSGQASEAEMKKLKAEEQTLQNFAKLDPALQAQRFQQDVGFVGTNSIVTKLIKQNYGDKIDSIKTKTYDERTEAELRGLLGSLGYSTSDFDKVMVGVANALEADFDPEKAVEDIAEAQAKAKANQKQTGENMANLFTQASTTDQMLQAAFNKYLLPINQSAENILAALRENWLIKTMTGGAGHTGEDYLAAKNELMNEIVRVSQISNAEDREKGIAGLSSLLAKFKMAGGDFRTFVEELKNAGIADDVIAKVQKAYDSAPGIANGKFEYSEAGTAAFLDAQGVTDPTERAQYLAQMGHESGSFKFREEQISEAEANKNYKGVNGNKEAGDGYKYRGRGIVQLTGRWNYMHYGKMIGVDLENNPDLAADPDVAQRVAWAYWQDRVRKNMKNFNDTDKATELINGKAKNGLADRKNRFARLQGSALTKAGTPQVQEPAQAATPTTGKKAAAKPIKVVQKPVQQPVDSHTQTNVKVTHAAGVPVTQQTIQRNSLSQSIPTA